MSRKIVDSLKQILQVNSNGDLAIKLGVSNALISTWHRGAQISVEKAALIEQVTYGAIKRHEIRPDVYAGYVPIKDCYREWEHKRAV